MNIGPAGARPVVPFEQHTCLHDYTIKNCCRTSVWATRLPDRGRPPVWRCRLRNLLFRSTHRRRNTT